MVRRKSGIPERLASCLPFLEKARSVYSSLALPEEPCKCASTFTIINFGTNYTFEGALNRISRVFC